MDKLIVSFQTNAAIRSDILKYLQYLETQSEERKRTIVLEDWMLNGEVPPPVVPKKKCRYDPYFNKV